MHYYILDRNLVLVKGIEVFQSVIWTERYYEPGEFELYLPASKEDMQFFRTAAEKHYYIIPAEFNDRTSISCMIINHVKLDMPFDAAKNIIITGRSLSYILHSRIAQGETILNGNLEDVIRDMVADNAINPADPSRSIPKLKLGARSGQISDLINAEATGAYLDEAITNICKIYKTGWDVRLNYDKKQFIFKMFKGLDRSYSQTAPELSDRNPYVVFSPDFDNLLKTTYDMDTSNYRNIIYVESEYQEYNDTTKTLDKKIFDVSATLPARSRYPKGLDRFEMFSSSSASSSAPKDEHNEPDRNFMAGIMRTEGKSKLKDYDSKTDMTGEVAPNLNFKLDEDYYIGDLVSVINEYGQTFDARVTETIHSVSTSEVKYYPVFVVENYEGKKEDQDYNIKEDDVFVLEDWTDTGANYQHFIVTEAGELVEKEKDFVVEDLVDESDYDVEIILENGNLIALTRYWDKDIDGK